jgi:hypothetical protein
MKASPNADLKQPSFVQGLECMAENEIGKTRKKKSLGNGRLNSKGLTHKERRKKVRL